MDFRILGPLEVDCEGRALPLGGRQQRELLALLLLHANEVVPVDEIIDELWPEAPPPSATKSIHALVSRLRRVLEGPSVTQNDGEGENGALLTRAHGYLLRVALGELDLHHFESLLREGRDALAAGEADVAARTLREALAVWRGPPLAEFDSFAVAEIARLNELRLTALELRIEADLAAGRSTELVAELEALIAAQPLRERLRGQLMLALYRADRQAEALQVYHDTRRLLVDELGIEPSPALRELEKAILSQDSGLAVPAPAERGPTNLPSPPTPLIGRERELAELLELTSQARLVTLTGVGGTGKTRLALEAAAKLVEAYPDGVWWVPLAALRDPELVEPTIAQTLAAKDGLAEHLRGKRTLLLLDNFEQLVEAAARLSELLADTEQVTILVTSREPLHLGAEHQYPVPPLPEEEAVELFTARARQLTPGFEPTETVAEICRRLDGIPLAIELAAARIKVLAPAALLERLEHPLSVLTGGNRDAPDRQRTLAATIAWSYELLSEREQALLRRLAVFAGDFTLEAAEEVCAADLDSLHSLVDKSVVDRRGDRFAMLETIREYALERLEASGEMDGIRRRHFDFFLALAEEARKDLARDQGAALWLPRLELEHDNCRAALRWARDLDEPRLELQLAAALLIFWHSRGHLDEGRSRIAEALARDPGAPAELRWRALRSATMMAHNQGDPDAARAFAQEAVAGHRATGDARGLAQAISLLGMVAASERKHREARALYEESKAMREKLGDEVQLQHSLHNLGLLALDQGQYDEARRQIEAALAIARRHRQEGRLANGLSGLGYVAIGQSRHAEARKLFEQSLRMSVEPGWKDFVDYCLVGLASVSAATQDLERAARLLGAAEALSDEINLRLEPPVESTRARTAHELDSRLGSDRFAACVAQGRSLSFSEAVSLALADGTDLDGAAGRPSGMDPPTRAGTRPRSGRT